MSVAADDTIFARATGAPPSAIAIIRVSGPGAGDTIRALAGDLPRPRRATLRTVRDGDEVLDRAMLLWLPGPATATGEDIAEFHLHGGRAVVSGVEAALARLPGLRPAGAGEFTRRALMNGRIDLTEAEGLADLLAAETAAQRRAALGLSSGALSRDIARWRDRLLDIAARIEADLDFADEGDVIAADDTVRADLRSLQTELAERLARPPVERLRDGIRVVLAGPPNAGKSSLFNSLVERDAAIVTPQAGTTRDVIEAPVAIGGIPFVLIDTAGLRASDDAIERIGVSRATDVIAGTDIVLWLGDDDPPLADDRYLRLHARADLPGRACPPVGRLAVSAVSREGLADLRDELIYRSTGLLPRDGELALNRRHRMLVGDMARSLGAAMDEHDPVMCAEHVRQGLAAIDRIAGAAGVEDMLDRLFAGMCIGK